MAKTRFTGKYRETEVRALVENYVGVLGDRDTDTRGMRALLCVADLKRAWRFLNHDERTILLLMGVVGLSDREAADKMAKGHTWANKRYRNALADLTWIMNGGNE